MSVVRRAILAVSERELVSRTVRSSPIFRGLVDRFVAGETLDSAIERALALKADGLTTTLDQLGEDVTSPADATAAASSYAAILHRLAKAGLEPNISVKLSMLGLDLDRELAVANMVTILEAARSVSGFVRIDMEGSAHTAVTMETFASLHDRFPDEVGIVIQAYLHRAEADVRWMIERQARVRLVKGAYAEPESVAYQQMADIRANFIRLMRLLLDEGRYPAIATHDQRLIDATAAHASEKGYAADRFEYQMLYGVRREEQRRMAARGQRMRVYVPFGTEWYPYFTRRIAERPANALFVLRQLRG